MIKFDVFEYFRRRKMLGNPKLPRFSGAYNYGGLKKKWDVGNTMKTNNRRC